MIINFLIIIQGHMTLHTNLSFETATGSIDYPFTNDYMFRAILQKDKQVLKALIAALLHLKKKVFTM